jgi:hypothetical protein
MMVGVRNDSAIFAQRVRALREVLYGEQGAPALAGALGLPVSTWLGYEAGVTMPAPVILRLIEVTGASPRSLLTGGSGAFRSRGALRQDRSR